MKCETEQAEDGRLRLSDDPYEQARLLAEQLNTKIPDYIPHHLWSVPILVAILQTIEDMQCDLVHRSLRSIEERIREIEGRMGP